MNDILQVSSIKGTMKTNLLKLIICFSFSFLSPAAIIPSMASSKELLLQTSELKSYSVLRISLQLSALDGVQLRGYHSCTQTLMITYDEEKLADPTIIISAIEHLNPGTCVLDAFYENLYSFLDRVEKYN